ncbi:MAG: tetratricopeptide repeat protein [Flavobacteriaceae bacterium]
MDLNDISQEEFERIEAYLNGQLSNDDLTIFEKRLKKENSFKSKVNDIKTVLTGLEAQALKEQLDVFHKDMVQTSNANVSTETKVRHLHWKKIAVAAALIIAAGSFWFISGNTNERLYAKYFTPDPGLPTTMSSTRDYDFNRAMVSYKQGNYEDAINAWKNQLATKVKNDTLNYFIGSALLADKKDKEAIKYLNIVTNISESLFNNEAYYYLGLAYLKGNNIELAKKNFTKSTIDDSKALLSELAD